MIEAYCFPRSAEPGESLAAARLDRRRRRSTSRSRGRAPTREVVWRAERRRGQRAPDPRRRRRERMRMAGRPRDPDRRGLAQRLLRGDPHRRRRARRRVPRGAARTRHAAGADHPRARRRPPGTPTTTGAARACTRAAREVSFERPLARGFLDKPRAEAAEDAARARPRGAVVLRVGRAARPVGVERRGRLGDLGARLRPLGRGERLRARRRDLARISSSTPRCSTAIACTSPSATTSTGHGACGRRSTPSPTPAATPRSSAGTPASGRCGSTTSVRSMTCFKYRADEDPVVGTADEPLVTGPWSDRRIAWPETRTIGLTFTHGGYSRYGLGVPAGSGAYTVWRPEHWAFEGTDLRYGDELGRADAIVAYEVDGVELATGPRRPAGPDGSRRRARRARDPGHRPGAPLEPARAAEPVRARARRAREHGDGGLRTRLARPGASRDEQPRVHRGVHEAAAAARCSTPASPTGRAASATRSSSESPATCSTDYRAEAAG